MPRLIDKMRACLSGPCGVYACPSVLDLVFLREVGLSPVLFGRAVRDCPNDEATGRFVLGQTSPALARIQALKDRIRPRWRSVLVVLDRDEDHVPCVGPLFQSSLWRAYQHWCAKNASAREI